jgi:septum formation protein
VRLVPAPAGGTFAVAVPIRLQLASTSPRRQELLRAAGIPFELCAPGAEYAGGGEIEPSFEHGDPATLARERAVRKASGAVPRDGSAPVLAVDTVVDLDGHELGKPRDRAEAERMLRRLAGRRHLVHTAHCLRVPATGWERNALATAVVACRQPTAGELRVYLDSGDWRGKAGAYGIQDPSQGFLSVLEGSFDTVMGMHVASVVELLRACGSGA